MNVRAVGVAIDSNIGAEVAQHALGVIARRLRLDHASAPGGMKTCNEYG